MPDTMGPDTDFASMSMGINWHMMRLNTILIEVASRLRLIGEQCNLESSFGDNPPGCMALLTPEAIP